MVVLKWCQRTHVEWQPGRIVNFGSTWVAACSFSVLSSAAQTLFSIAHMFTLPWNTTSHAKSYMTAFGPSRCRT